jgi:hypothetical protein
MGAYAKHIALIRECKNCGQEYKAKSHLYVFCSHNCSASYNNPRRNARSVESRQKTATSLKIFSEENPHLVKARSAKMRGQRGFPHSKIWPHKICTCGIGFWPRTHDKKTCSPECARKNSTYRQIRIDYHRTNGDIVVMESSWEVAIAEWLDYNLIEWIRPSHLKWIDSKGKNRKYFSDFYIPKFDLYLDPKNDYRIECDREKLEYFSSRINLFYGRVDDIIAKIEEKCQERSIGK